MRKKRIPGIREAGEAFRLGSLKAPLGNAAVVLCSAAYAGRATHVSVFLTRYATRRVEML